VSRFQLLFAVGFAAVVYLMLYRHVTWKMIAAAVVILIPVYVLLTVARRHNITYLNGIFEMKYSKMPIFITQPYIYVANNYENFNCMVRQLPEFAMGLRMLFPVFALTGLKFVFPQVAAFPLYTTKEELTTVTLFYDAYYDFGIAGIILLASLLGVGAAWLSSRAEKSSNPVVYLFYGQIAIYLGLSFFTTWFSNPTTWFWLALTFMMYLFIGYEKKELG
jgi:oligosaccharide repeat unit polymerase